MSDDAPLPGAPLSGDGAPSSGDSAADQAPPPGDSTDSKGSPIWRETKGLLWVLIAVLAFHSFVAKPFYIPSESMMPGLLKGDRLVVSKYPYGWSWVSPSFHIFPHWEGRLLGKMPKRGDVVIVTPPGQSDDYIKRVIGLPGDTVQVRDGRLILNGRPVRSQVRPAALIPIDPNVPCNLEFADSIVRSGGREYCRLPIVRETLPNGVTYDTIDLDNVTSGNNYPVTKVPAGHVFLMGDNRDRSADSRFGLGQPENGLGGPVPWENIGGRAEFVTFSLDGTTQIFNPVTWFSALRGNRAGQSLRGTSE